VSFLERTADEAKEKGNELYKAAKYKEAIDVYSKAIGITDFVNFVLFIPQEM
jgi:hypothetical protein